MTVDIREVNRELARLASEATKQDARARRAWAKAEEASSHAVEAWAAWHKAWKAAAPVMAEGDGEPTKEVVG